jgi:hypothetical protein
MKKRVRFTGLFLLCAGFATWAGQHIQDNPTALVAEASAAEKDAPTDSAAAAVPVEGDMHEFMEYVFEPPYKRLKAALAGETLDKAAFKTVKSDGLILAEGGNLLLMRSPEKDAAAWKERAIAVREAGAELYRAGKAKDADASRKTFAALLKNCNACHDQFADGEHQLSP